MSSLATLGALYSFPLPPCLAGSLSSEETFCSQGKHCLVLFSLGGTASHISGEFSLTRLPGEPQSTEKSVFASFPPRAGRPLWKNLAHCSLGLWKEFSTFWGQQWGACFPQESEPSRLDPVWSKLAVGHGGDCGRVCPSGVIWFPSFQHIKFLPVTGLIILGTPGAGSHRDLGCDLWLKWDSKTVIIHLWQPILPEP